MENPATDGWKVQPSGIICGSSQGRGDPMKAILPVAGVGTRLRPLTHTQPKTLVHVAGKPILGHILDRLAPVGVDEVVLIVGQWGVRIVDDVVKSYPRMKVTAVDQA